MTAKRTIILIDDLFRSADDFWSTNEESRTVFEERYDLTVFDYPGDALFHKQQLRIEEFLVTQSGHAQVLVLDMQFPGDNWGGLKALEFIKRSGIDIPVVLVVSSSDDPALAVQLAGYPFVHRHTRLDIARIISWLDEIFSTESFDHPERGILITHGTDTLAYALEFLRYGIRNSYLTNIIITGSQIPMGEAGAASDAVDNVRSSVLLLQRLYAPQLGAVFNRGEQFFRSNIQKISKWHPEAFYGFCDVDLDWDRFRTNLPAVKLRNAPPPLQELILLRTGGTIESVRVEGRGYVPGGDFVASFVSGNLKNHYVRLRTIPFTALDSSNMTFADWMRLLDLMRDECGLTVDTSFEPRVGLITPSPMLTTSDYLAWMKRFEGIVIAGYGAGNANALIDSSYSLLRAVDEYCKKKPVVLASQVPREMTDFAYEVAVEFIKAGCIPSGHLSFQAAQVRLSYLLGHRERFALKSADAMREMFVQGLMFRSARSKAACEDIINWRRMSSAQRRKVPPIGHRIPGEFKILARDSLFLKED